MKDLKKDIEFIFLRLNHDQLCKSYGKTGLATCEGCCAQDLRDCCDRYISVFLKLR